MNRTERLLRWLNEPIGAAALDDIRRRERRKLKRQQAFNVALIAGTACVWLAVIALVVEILGRV